MLSSRNLTASSQFNKQLLKSIVSRYSTITSCPHLVEEAAGQAALKNSNAKPYSEVPGPKPMPILGNTWRLVLRYYWGRPKALSVLHDQTMHCTVDSLFKFVVGLNVEVAFCLISFVVFNGISIDRKCGIVA